MKLLLTDRFCQTAKSKTPQTDYFDVTVRGLALRVTRQGTKAWTFHYTSGNKRVRKTLGRYPAVSLAGARTLASEATTAVAEGRDPRYAAGSMTVASLAERYIGSIQGLRSAKEIERRIAAQQIARRAAMRDDDHPSCIPDCAGAVCADGMIPRAGSSVHTFKTTRFQRTPDLSA